MTQDESGEQLTVPYPSRKRRALAIYLDLCVFGSVWTVGTLWLAPVFDSLWVRLIAFALLEALLFPKRWSFGLYALSIYNYPTPDPEVDRWGVAPEVKSKETWLTMIFATLLLLDGPRAMVRWATYEPPRPYFGVVPNDSIAPILEVAYGVIAVFVGVALLKMSRAGLWSALILSTALIVSTVLSWDGYSAYLEVYAQQRAAERDQPFEPRIVQFMLPIVIVGTIMVSALLALLVVAYRKRFTNVLAKT